MIVDSRYHIYESAPIPTGKMAILFPSEDSKPWSNVSFDSLLIPDGTWDDARAMLRNTPALQAIPKISMQNSYEGGYLARRSPFAGALCTAEALGYLYLEMGFVDGQKLLDMVEQLNQDQRYFAGQGASRDGF